MESETLLELHERLRREGIPVASILVARTCGEARAYWSAWMRERQRSVVISPKPNSAAGLAAWKFRAGNSLEKPPGLLFVGPTPIVLAAAIEAAQLMPKVTVAAVTATDALAMELGSSDIAAPLLRDILKGLTPLSIEDGRILDVIASRPATQPLLRSAFEGVLYYLLEARPETHGRFKPNQRIARPDGHGSDEVDLVDGKAKLAIEIDGGQHTTWDHTQRDQQKDARLRALGYEVLRFDAKVVVTKPGEVWQRIHQVTRQRDIS